MSSVLNLIDEFRNKDFKRDKINYLDLQNTLMVLFLIGINELSILFLQKFDIFIHLIYIFMMIHYFNV